MANVKISDLTAQAGDTIPTGLLLEGEQAGGASVKISEAQLAKFIRATIGAALQQSGAASVTLSNGGDTITIGATGGGGGGGVMRHPGYRAGAWYRMGPYGTASQTPAVNTLYFLPMVVDESVVVDRIGVQLNTNTAGASALVGVYASDPTTKQPAAQLFRGAGPLDFAAGASGVVNAGLVDAAGNALANYVLAPGFYWRAYLALGLTASVLGSLSSDAGVANVLGHTTAAAPNALAAIAYGTALPLSGAGGAVPQAGAAAGFPVLRVA